MNTLESRLEEVAFNYVGLGVLSIVNNLWTWVAILTATISFWRIKAGARASSCSVKSEEKPTRVDRRTVGSEPNLGTSTDEVSSIASPVMAAPIIPSVCNEEITKGKFIMYYEDEGESDGELTAVREWRNREDEGCGEWWEVWERVLRMRRGEDWYRFLDLTLLNGNVVRLWDGNSSAEYRPRSCLFGR
ncbi:uncharacterized protein LOC110809303 [Carica papaya]|uniref:uncharacterized protein LOC110809303 n=1 Tax=Carica papaya TaxID=3649 RepID=UPI000B8D0A64|nr:uncharacterized protein LOC110809303 [Carica papaya]